jgi:hypothetical protein
MRWSIAPTDEFVGVWISTSLWVSGFPKVALKRTGGSYVVVYNGFDQTSEHVRVAEVSASDRVTTYDAGVPSDASVSINGAGQYLVTYTSNDGGDLNIRRRIGHI